MNTRTFFQWWAALCMIALSLFASACERCATDPPLAKLVTKSGAVERDYAKSEGTWSDAKVGGEYQVGDAVHTREGAAAELDLDDGSVLALEESTLIRFLDRAPGSEQQSFDLELGTASLQAPEAGATISTAFGLARLTGGAKVSLRRSGDELRYEVMLGKAKLESISGQSLEVKAGEVIEISLGRAVLTPVTPEPKPEPEQKEPEPDTSKDITATVVGSGVKMRAPGTAEYVAVGAGQTKVAAGSTVQVSGQSQVVVTQGQNQATLASGGTYTIGGAGLVSAESGTVTVATEDTVAIRVPGGVIVTSRGSATITQKADGSHVKVDSGSADLKGKESESLFVGEQGILKTDGTVVVEGRGLSQADIDLAAGSGIVIHDPSPPTRIKFLFAGKCADGIIRTTSNKARPHWARGKGEVILPVGPGVVPYKLSCVDEKGIEQPTDAAGQITVLNDTGSKPMPKKAPSTFVDINGRGYTVLYQNQLPQVTVQWDKAPADASGFQVHVKSGSGTQTFSSAKPSYTFSSGRLLSGTHTVHMTGGGQVSRRTSITIRFDDASSTASLDTPVNTGVGPGGTITVSGQTLPGWSASVDGRPLSQDAGNRFSVETQMPSDGQALRIGLSHPTRGTHVYLRRPAGAK